MSLPDVRTRKAQLRRETRSRRDAVPVRSRAAADASIEARVAGLDAFAQADAVLTYLSFGSEVETCGIIMRALAADKLVALPRCVPGTRDMEWFSIDDLDGLERSPFGVLEPSRDPARRVDPAAFSGVAKAGEADAPPSALAIVPGLAFDAHGYRLGYGGGFYDVFLSGFRGASAGLCREAALVRSLAAEGAVDAFDHPVDLIVTEARVLSC